MGLNCFTFESIYFLNPICMERKKQNVKSCNSISPIRSTPNLYLKYFWHGTTCILQTSNDSEFVQFAQVNTSKTSGHLVGQKMNQKARHKRIWESCKYEEQKDDMKIMPIVTLIKISYS